MVAPVESYLARRRNMGVGYPNLANNNEFYFVQQKCISLKNICAEEILEIIW